MCPARCGGTGRHAARPACAVGAAAWSAVALIRSTKGYSATRDLETGETLRSCSGNLLRPELWRVDCRIADPIAMIAPRIDAFQGHQALSVY